MLQGRETGEPAAPEATATATPVVLSKTTRRAQLLEMRRKHGFVSVGTHTRGSTWSKTAIEPIAEGEITRIDELEVERPDRAAFARQLRAALDEAIIAHIEQLFDDEDAHRPEPYMLSDVMRLRAEGIQRKAMERAAKRLHGPKRDEALAEAEAYTFNPGGYTPRNWAVLSAVAIRFPGFAWSVKPHISGKSGAVTFNITYPNGYPKIGGVSVTLADALLADIGLFDPSCVEERAIDPTIGQPVDGANDVRQRMDSLNIGYKGLSGVSWLQAVNPVALPTDVLRQIEEIGEAIFALNDAATAVLPVDEDLQWLLNFKRPDRIPNLTGSSRVMLTRPDICLMEHPDDGRLIAVCTEIESAPAGQGMADAMHLGYEMGMPVAETMVEMLAGRELVIVVTHQWAEYIFDQAVWVSLIRKAGGRARIIFDASLDKVSTVARGWKAPRSGLKWNKHVLQRLQDAGFLGFISGTHQLPQSVGGADAVVWRFGYFDQFSHQLAAFFRWEGQGTAIFNGADFFAESKVLMAAVANPVVRAWIVEHRSPRLLEVLDTHIATTRLLNSGGQPTVMTREELLADRQHWLVKFAGMDGDNMSWGSRSLVVGAQCTNTVWGQQLMDYEDARHPVVAQHLIRGTQFTTDFVDNDGLRRRMDGARSRVTPMLFRTPDNGCKVAGTVITLRPGTMRIHGATDAIECPVVFND